MSRGLLFWILMVAWFVFSLWFYWPAQGAGYSVLGGPVLLFILFALLGWKVFGPVIKGD